MKKLLGIAIACSLLLSACKPSEIRLAERCQSSTVLLHMKVSMGDKQGWGTCAGVYVAPDKILTADHCVDMHEDDLKLKEIWVGNIDGDSARAYVLKTNPEKDLALLKTTLTGTPVKLARKVVVGETCWTVGNPLGLPFIVSKGIISCVDLILSADDATHHFVIDSVVLPGNSGGPCFNDRGQLIGIVVRSTSELGPLGASGLGFVVQINEVRAFLKNK